MSQLNAERKTLEILAEEFAARYRRGERPALSEYIDAHPELAAEIRELFPTLVLIEALAPSDSDSAAPAAAAPVKPPRLSLGDYRILREIGRGGMGVVYEAEQLSLGRRVALKVLRQVVSDATVRQRFHREARAAAQLHHTNIVPVFEVGENPESCWYAMQLILGQGLDQIIEELRQQRQPLSAGHPPLSQVTQAFVSGQLAAPSLDPPPALASSVSRDAQGSASALPCASRLTEEASASLTSCSELSAGDSARGQYYRSVARIGRQAAEALAHAHARGIIHRDIKPSNLLLDTAGIVWITDFGLAKTHDVALTTTGDIVGTLRYMAPERLRGEGDERADVYALGLTLYELLVLRPAFEAPDRLQLIDGIKNQEPARPRAVDRRIPRDLETIILTATHKEAKRRYQSAEAMAEDLRRFLANEPIKAKRTSPLVRLRLWSRRHPALAALLVVLMLVAAGSTAFAFYLRTTLAESEDNRKRAEKAELEGKHKLWLSYLSQARAMRMSRQSGQRFASLNAIKEALALPVPPDRSRDELRTEAIAALCLPDLELVREVGVETVGANGFTIDDAFQRYAWGDKEGNIHVCRLSDGRELLHLPGAGVVSDYWGLQFSPDGRFLHQGCETPKGDRSRLWDLTAQPVKVVLDNDHGTTAFRPDSRQVAAAYPDGSIRLHETASGREVRRFPVGKKILQLCWNPKSPKLLVLTAASFRLLDLDTGEIAMVGPKVSGGTSSVAWHPEGRLLALGGGKGSKIYLWDVLSSRLVLPPLEGHKNWGVVMCFNHAGDRLLSTDWSGSWHLWDTQSGQLLLRLPALGPFFTFSSDDRLVGTGRLGQARLYNFRRGEEFRTVVHRNKAGQRGSYTGRASASADREGRCYAFFAEDGLAVVDVERGEEAAVLPQNGSVPLCFESQGALWTHGDPGLLRWPLAVDPATGQRRYGPPKRFFGRTSWDLHGSSTDAKVVAIPQFDRGALVFHRDSKRVLRLGPQQDVRNCAVSPDGRWVATGSHTLHDGAGAKIWDAKDGRHVKDLPVGGLCAVRFSSDGKWLLTQGGAPRLWVVGTWEEGPNIGGNPLSNWGAFSRDSELLAVGDAPGTLRLLLLDSGAEIARLTAPEQTRLLVHGFTPDSTQLVVFGAETASLHIFDLRAIRAGLAELGLDWDAPPLPAAPRGAEATLLAKPPLSIRFDRGDSEHWPQADALVQQAAQQIRGKDYARGLAALQQAVKIAPSNAVAHNNLAWLLLTGPKGLRNPAQALPEARKAVELEPDQPMYANTLGVALYYTRQFADAVPVLERSLREQKGQADAFDLFFLAMCHHRLGDAAKAKDCHARGKQWFQMHKGQLRTEWVEELTAFQAEAESVLAQAPGQAKKPDTKK